MKTAPREEPRDEFNADANLYVSGFRRVRTRITCEISSRRTDWYKRRKSFAITRDAGAERIRLCADDGSRARASAIASLNGQLLPNAYRPLTVRVADNTETFHRHLSPR